MFLFNLESLLQANMPQYKLHYFNFRGRAELARLILKQAGVEFEDVRFERTEWPALKASEFVFLYNVIVMTF